MNIIANIALDMLAIIIIISIIFSCRFSQITKSFDSILFLILMIGILLFITTDLIYYLLYRNGKDYILALRLIKCLYFVINVIISFLWLVYIDYKVHSSYERIVKRLKYYLPLCIIGIGMAITNIFTDLFFTITNEGTFKAVEVWMVLYTLIPYIYVILSLAIIIYNRKRIIRKNFIPLLMFSIPVVAFMSIQVIFKEISLISCYSISILIVYINIQNDLAYIDSLTELYNRRYLIEYLGSEVRKRKDYLGGVMIDLDGFKYINDTYGHLVGDKVLQAVANILSQSIEYQDLLARYAGDEFIIITHKDKDEMKEFFERIDANCFKFNESKALPCKIGFSKGYYISEKVENETMDSLLQKIDQAMYVVKRKKKETGIGSSEVK